MPTCTLNNVYNPFSKKSKEMIRELSCVKLPKVHCSHCLLYWNQGICVLHLRTMLD